MGRAATGQPALEHADAEPALLCAPGRRETDDPAADDDRVEPLHHADDRVCRREWHDNRSARLARSRLYLVLEARPHGQDPSALLDAALRGGVDVVQLREKELRDDDLVRAAEPFRRACDAHGALFVLNDRPDLVERAGADGVHVGQGDASLAEARRAVGDDRLVGLSASTREELRGDPRLLRRRRRVRHADEARGGRRRPRARARGPRHAPHAVVRNRRHRRGDDRRMSQAPAPTVSPSSARFATQRTPRPLRARCAACCRRAMPSSCAARRCLLPQIEWLFGTWAPGQRPVAPHTHAAHTDLFYVLDGTMEFRLGDGTVRVPAGSCVAAPPLLVHGFRNPGDVDAPVSQPPRARRMGAQPRRTACLRRTTTRSARIAPRRARVRSSARPATAIA